ncbi:MAG TPA: hypothetical protein VFQ53_23060 [Kofleriaceae bacterium]|nr:hypothetical protein [Kofleriaceae bacterium]
MRIVLCLVVFAPLTLTTLAAADPLPDARKMATDDCARARKAGKTCVITIGEGESLDGRVPTAGEGIISIPGTDKAASLIHIRHDFIPEILKSAEDL